MRSGSTPTGSPHNSCHSINEMSIVYKELINSTIQKLSASMKKVKRPHVLVNINGHQISALYDTGADMCCMSDTLFRKVFPVGKRPKKLNVISTVTSASGNKIACEGVYPIPFEIKNKKFVYDIHVLSNLSGDLIMGINFFHDVGLAYDPGNQEIYWTDKTGSNWTTANLQCPAKLTLEPTSNKMVTLNVITRKGYRIAQACDAVAVISSGTYVIQGGPALVRINKLGQATMEIFNCTNHEMTIEKDSLVGIVENLREEDEVGELNVNEMTVNIQKQQLPPAKILTQEKRKYIAEHATLNVPEQFKKKYLDLLMKHHEVISDNKYDLGKCSTAMHDIEMKSENPIYVKQFKIQDDQQEAVKRHVEELLKLGVVRPSNSKFNSPMFVVAKKDGGVRIVQDFRAINQQTMVDKYSMRDVQECIDEIGRAGSSIFSTIDLTSGFWQMMLSPECRKYTAFTIPGVGQFEWNASPMGLLGAPGSFQRLMEIVIHNLSNILAYIDDLLVHTKDHGKHLEILDELFTRLRKHGLKINLPKSFFGATEVSYLGFKLTPDGIKPGSDKLKAVAAAAPPNDITEVRAFLGLCNFFRGHVRNFAQLAAPLNLLTTNTCEWKGGPLPADADKAFKELKSVLVSEPVVHYPNPNLPYALITEAWSADATSPGGYSAILAQILPGEELEVISYASRKLKCHEKNYEPFLLEIAASSWGMDHFDVYLKGKHFVLYTDNKPVTILKPVHVKTLHRLEETLREFDFEIIYRKGDEMPSDLQSRKFINLIQIDNRQMEKDQDREEWIKQLKTWRLNGSECTHPTAKLLTKDYLSKMFFIEDDILWVRIQTKGEPTRVCVVLPKTRVQEILKEEHGALFNGHEGVAKTRFNLTKKYWWPCMDRDIAEFLKNCGNCQKAKESRKTPPNLLTPSSGCDKTYQRVHLDMIAAPVASGNNNRYILSFTDAFSKYTELIAISDRTPETVAKEIFSKWICRYGVPTEIIVNREMDFCNELTSELFKVMKMTPDTDANFPAFYFQEATANRTINKYLRQIFELTTVDWEIYLAPLMFSYNTSFNRKFQTSPHFVIFGQQARQPAFNHGNWEKKCLGESSAAEKYQTLQTTRQVAWQSVAQQQQMNFKIYEYQSAAHEFKPEQWVLMKNNRNKFEGPFQIVKIKPHNTVEIKTDTKTNILVHVKNLKPFHGNHSTNFASNFQKQGGDANYFDDPEEEEENFERSDMKDRKDRQPPREQYQDDEDKPEPGHSDQDTDSEDEDCRITFPSKREMERRYFIPNRSQDQKTETDTEIEIKEEGEEALPDEEPVRREPSRGGEPQGDQWITSKLRKNVGKRIRVLEQQQIESQTQAKNLINIDLVRLNLLSQINPFITECRNLIKRLPKGLIKRTYPNWNNNQVINYWWSGDINMGPDVPNFISLSDHPYLPTTIFGNQIPVNDPQPLNNQPVDIDENLFEDEDGIPTPPGSPQPSTSTRPTGTERRSRSRSRGPSPGKTLGYDPANVRPELRAARFQEARRMQDLNTDEQVFFQKTFYGNVNPDRPVLQEQGRPSRSNPEGLRTFLKPKKK